MSIGENIKLYRNKLGLTQKQLAENCSLSESAIKYYENNRRNPKIETLNKIADTLGVSTNDLVNINEFREEINFIDNRQYTIKSKMNELESNIKLLKETLDILTFALKNENNKNEQIKEYDLKSIMDNLNNLPEKMDKVLDIISPKRENDITIEEEIKFLSCSELIDLDNTNSSPEDSAGIRYSIIKIIKCLQYNTDNLSRESFDIIIKSVLNTIEFEMYKLKNN